MSVDTKDLRIGNWVQANELHKGKFVEVKYWDSTTNILFFKQSIVGEYRTDCEPIPLTEDILIKCGFEKLKISRNPFLQLQITDKVKLMFIENKVDVGIMGVSQYEWSDLVYCEYLHQLQNLYYSLTGKELITDKLNF